MRKPNKKTLLTIGLTILIVTLLFQITMALLILQISLRGIGKVKTSELKAFSDPECTQPLTEINWGIFYEDDMKMITIYLLKDSPKNISLVGYANNWSPPEAKNVITWSWDGDGKIITDKNPFKVIFIVTSSVTEPIGFTDFSFDVHLIGTQI